MTRKPTSGIEYTKIAEIKGTIIVVDGATTVSFDELVEIEGVEVRLLKEDEIYMC